MIPWVVPPFILNCIFFFGGICFTIYVTQFPTRPLCKREATLPCIDMMRAHAES
jgi:hypothetical protein